MIFNWILLSSLVAMALLSLSFSFAMLNRNFIRGESTTTSVNETKEPNVEDLVTNKRSTWIDRLLRRKVSLSSMDSLTRNNDDERAVNINFTGWESYGGRGPIAIFYNVFVPFPSSEVRNALDIVKEQIAAIAKSPVSLEPLSLYYNLIGNAKALNETTMRTLCRNQSSNLQCQLLHTYESASEHVTLQSMLDFCHDHPTHRVTYLHTKGAFHPSAKNTNWRKLLTFAALHPDCMRRTACNLCGLQFVTQFTFFIPGNMFTADCSYVKKLLPLSEFRERQEERVKEVLLLKLKNQLRSSLIPDQLDYFGMDRYADEHWIGSHPDVVACDMDPFSDIARIFNGTLKASQLEWKNAPRISGVVGGIGDDRQGLVRNNTDLRRREVLLLPGLIQRWWKLYEQLPDPSSWIWKFFPDGDFWQEAIQKFGPSEALSKVTARYRTTVDGMPLASGFQPFDHARANELEQLLEQNENGLNTTSSPTVFYHVVVPDRDEITIKQATKLLDDQLALISTSSLAQINLWYTVAGGNAMIQSSVKETIRNHCEAHDHLHCQFLGSFDEAYEGESLRRLHRYCVLHPQNKVTYIHNLPPPQLRMTGSNENLINSLTKAALSEDCTKSLPSCNVCGLVFYNLWTHFFPGNMFTADCEYVSKLAAPSEYETKMNDFIGDVLMMKLRNILVTKLFPERADVYGLGRHSLEYWIGSHPDLVPCDLSNETQDLSFWRRQGEHADFHWGVAPRRIEATPFGSIQQNVLQQESLRLREYSLLPGHILRWNYFYNQTPGPFSWQWFAAPDGFKWLKAIHDFGNQSVVALTAEYAKDVY